MKSFVQIVLSVMAATFLLVQTAVAQDPVKVAPEHYKVLLNNDQVRVLDIHLKPGDKSPMHSHPNYVVYALSDSTVTFTSPNGKTKKVTMKAGEAMFRNAESHAVENIGKRETHVLNIELKAASKR